MVCLNMYFQALKHTSATFAAASTNLIPAITFVIALILRIERMYVKELHGWVQLIGSIVSVSGAFVFAFVKGQSLNFILVLKLLQRRINIVRKGTFLKALLQCLARTFFGLVGALCRRPL